MGKAICWKWAGKSSGNFNHQRQNAIVLYVRMGLL